MSVFRVAMCLLGLSACVLGGCGGTAPPTAPSAPTPTPTATPAPVPVPAKPVYTITGVVLVTNDGRPAIGATVLMSVAGPVSDPTSVATITTDGTGRFTFTHSLPATFLRLSVTGTDLIDRTVYIEGERSREVSIQVYREDFNFHIRDFRTYLRHAKFDAPNRLSPLRHLESPMRLYVRNVDAAGRAVSPRLLEIATNVIRETSSDLSGGVMAVTSVEQGPLYASEQPDQTIVVRWNSISPSFCDGFGGGIRFADIHLRTDGCGCNGFPIDPAAVRHAVAELLGFEDTDVFGGVTYDGLTFDIGHRFGLGQTCDSKPSAEERRYGRYLYTRPAGNTDPDDDPLRYVSP